jgi:hypothetical protein
MAAGNIVVTFMPAPVLALNGMATRMVFTPWVAQQ